MRVGATRLGAVASGGLSLLLLAALLLGVPIGLYVLAGWPLPHEVPSWDEVSNALTSTDIPSAFYTGAFAVVCWLVWLQVLASVVLEAVAQVRGVAAPTLPLGGRLQGWVQKLVASVALIFSVVGPRAAMAAPLPPPPPPVVASMAGVAAPVESDRAPAPGPVCTVEVREDLWRIAERYLGDPNRWREIFNLNVGRVQPDGGTLREVDDDLRAGWVLELPADASRASRSTPGEPGSRPSAAVGGSQRGATEGQAPRTPQVALRPSPGRIAAELAEQAFDPDPAVREEVAAHPLTPGAVLWHMTCNEPEPSVRRALAANPSLPPAALLVIGTSADESLREAAARHPSAPPQLIKFLAADPVHEVSQAAGERLAATGLSSVGSTPA